MSYTIKDVEAFCLYMQEQVDAGTSVGDALQAFRDMQPKIPGEGEGVIVVLNYGPKSHAVFGADTKPVKDGLLALNTPGKHDVTSFNGKLEFGAGWVITNKTKLKTVLEFLDESEIAHTEIEREAFVAGEEDDAKPVAPKKAAPAKAVKKAPAKAKAPTKAKPKVESDVEDEEEEPAPKKATKKPAAKVAAKKTASTKTAAPAKKVQPKGKASTKKTVAKAPPAKTATKTLKAIQNAQGNFEEEETGIVFVEAPVGTGGRKIKIAVGVQDAESEEMGLASVKPLDADMIAECDERKWQYLTDAMMKVLSKKDTELHEELAALRARGSDAEEANDEEEAGDGDEADVEEEEE